MSAELLRRAATEMRERANTAMPGGWYAGTSNWVIAVFGDLADEYDVAKAQNAADAEYIASWHPAVALAVADWLDAAADDCPACIRAEPALALARAYLGEEAS